MSSVMTLKRYPSQGGMTFGKIGARRMMWSINNLLPKGGRWVEYLEATGTQWIDTGVTPQIQGISKIDFKPTVNHPVPWGCLNFTEVSAYARYFRADGVASAADRYPDTRYVVELNGATKRYITNGVVSPFSGYLFFESASGNCWLFGRSDTGALGKLAIYSASFTDSAGTLVRDFRPIAIGTTGYMLDLVSGEYLPYGNKGTGNFVIGPDAQPPTI